MGFFRNLWDEGSTSDSGMGKFRRYNSLISRSYNSNNNNPPTGDAIPVSRTITILPTNSLASGSGSISSSQSGSTSAASPFSATSPGGDIKKLTRRKSAANTHRREPKSLTGYDWIFLTSIDR